WLASRRNADLFVEELGQGLNAVDETWPGPRKKAVRFTGIDLPGMNRQNLPPLRRKRQRQTFFRGLSCAVATGGNQNDLRAGFEQIVQGDPERWLADPAENIVSAGKVNHLRNPVPANVERLQPFEQRDTRPLDFPHVCELALHLT